MKFTIDVADEDVAKFIALVQGSKAAEPAADAPKTTEPTKAPTKVKAAPKPAAAPAAAPKVAAPTRDQVHEALRIRTAADGGDKDPALAVLHKYSPTLSGLAEDDFAKVIAELSAPADAADEDAFG